MKKLLIILIGVFIFSIGCTKLHKPEKTMPITQEQFMIIYENGYRSGTLNQMINSTRPTVYEYQWRKDSLYIINMFKDSFK